MGKFAERVSDVALGAVKYVLAIAVVVGSMVAVFYTSQAAQDADRAAAKERVRAVETVVDVVKESQRTTQVAVEKQREDIARTREEMAKLSQAQQAMSDEQKTLNVKMDEMKTLLIRMDRRRDP